MSNKDAKILIQKTFNNQFFDFFNAVLEIFPGNVDILTAKTSFESIKKMNPSALIKAWYIYVYLVYKDKIEAGDLNYFFEKDYSEELAHLRNSTEIMKIIDSVRQPLLNMSDTSKSTANEYISNFNKLSVKYAELQ
jgi:hypothetical protein